MGQCIYNIIFHKRYQCCYYDPPLPPLPPHPPPEAPKTLTYSYFKYSPAALLRYLINLVYTASSKCLLVDPSTLKSGLRSSVNFLKVKILAGLGRRRWRNTGNSFAICNKNKSAHDLLTGETNGTEFRLRPFVRYITLIYLENSQLSQTIPKLQHTLGRLRNRKYFLEIFFSNKSWHSTILKHAEAC